MSKYNFGVLACKILSLYSLIQAIGFFQITAFQVATSNVAANGGPDRIFVRVAAIIPFALFMILAGILWFFADFISNRMTDGLEEAAGVTQELTSKDIEIVGFSLLGLFVATQAIPHLTDALSSYYQVPKEIRLNSPIDFRTKIRLISTGLQFLIGLLLVFGSKGLVGIIRKLRELGLSTIDKEK